MTENEKQRIILMRNTGNGYEKIAKALNLSKSTVAAFCKRNQLSGVRANVPGKESFAISKTKKPLSKGQRYSVILNEYMVAIQYADDDDNAAVSDITQMLTRGNR